MNGTTTIASSPGQRGVAGRSEDAIDRTRLFSRLDGLASCPAVWVFGPPGSGKTMLLQTWIASRGIEAQWIDVSAGDAETDVLAMLAKRADSRRPPRAARQTADGGGRRRIAHPKAGVSGEGGRARPLVVVLEVTGIDNEGAVAVIRDALESGLSAQAVIFLARYEPPRELSRHVLSGRLGLLDGGALRFDLDEVSRLAARLGCTDPMATRAAHQDSAGWATGVRMLLEESVFDPVTAAGYRAINRQMLYSFLAREVFQALPESMQQTLIATCLLPVLSRELVAGMGGDMEDWSALSALGGQGTFLVPADSAPHALAYSKLFGEFLQHEARAALGMTGFRSLQERTAAVLSAAERPAEAIALYLASGDWVSASHRIMLDAASMLVQGRSATLHGWLAVVPSWLVDASPRLLYCLGLTQSVLDPSSAVATLDRAFHRFAAERQSVGQALVAAAAIHAIHVRYDSVDAYDPWLDRLCELMKGEILFPSASMEMHVLSMLQIALTARRPDHELLPMCTDRLLGLLGRGLEINQTVVAAASLVCHFSWFAPDKARLVCGFVQPLLRNAALLPVNRLWWILSEANHLQLSGDRSAALAKYDEARSACLETVDRPAAAIRAVIDAFSGDDSAASLRRDEAQAAMLSPLRRQEEQNFLTGLIGRALRCGDSVRARRYAEKALLLAKSISHRSCEFEGLGWLAAVEIDSGNLSRAGELIADARGLVGDVDAPQIELHHRLLEAWAACRGDGEEARHAGLNAAFVYARTHGLTVGYQDLPQVLAWLCAKALERGIEPEHVRHIIRTRGLSPVDGDAAESWPWPIDIRVLGGFEIVVEDTPIVFARKAQKKPLELLATLVMRGRAGVSQEALSEEMWADSEGDAAMSSLRMAIHRLRALLGDDAAVLVSQGRVRLNTDLCRVDLWAFEALCRRDLPAVPSRIEETVARARDLYRGPAFGDEVFASGMIQARRRGQALLRAFVDSACERLNALDRHQVAKSLRIWSESVSPDNAQAQPAIEPPIAVSPTCKRRSQREGGLCAPQATESSDDMA